MKSLLDNLSTRVIGKKIIYLEEVGSTNLVAKQLGREGLEEGVIVLADRQTEGRGRLGRTWESPKGTGIWMSLLLRPTISPEKVSLLTLLAGLQICQVIEEITTLPAKIKWPNDIVVNGKKVCGILTEAIIDQNDVKQVVVGIGINVNMSSMPENLPYATSLFLESKKVYDRQILIARFCQAFEKTYQQFIDVGNFAPFLDEYHKRCVTLGKKVSILDAQEIVGYAKRITQAGELCVEKEDGTWITVHAGEVSVRGLYGYV